MERFILMGLTLLCTQSLVDLICNDSLPETNYEENPNGIDSCQPDISVHIEHNPELGIPSFETTN